MYKGRRLLDNFKELEKDIIRNLNNKTGSQRKYVHFKIDNLSELSYLHVFSKTFFDLIRIIDRNKNRIKKKSILQFNFLYLEDNFLNAIATSYKNNNVVLMNIGTISKINRLFFDMLRDPEIFNDVKDDPKTNINISGKRITNRLSSKQIISLKIHDRRREDLMFCLIHWAVRFILLHELGHHYNGHIKFLENEYNLSTLAMCNNKLEKLSNLDYQTLEMDADAFAIGQSVDHVLSLYINKNNILSHNSILRKIINEDFDKIIFYWGIAIHCLFLLFEKSHHVDDVHLQRRLRQNIALNTAIECVEKDGGDMIDCNKFVDLMYKAQEYAEKAYNKVQNTKTDYDEIKKIMNLHQLISVQNIFDNWKNVRPELEKYTYFNLASCNNYY